MKFERRLYFSQTEITGIFQIIPDEYKALILEKNLPVINRKVNLGNYDVEAVYTFKTDFLKLGIPKRPLR